MRRSMLALLAALTAVTACTSDGNNARSTAPASPDPITADTSGSPATRTATPSATPTPSASARSTTPAPRSSSASSTHRATPARLPLALSTGDAWQVITVVASSSSSTTAVLQAWTRSGSGWRRVGPSVDAHLGSDGIGRASESSARTPAGSFTLTQAFGHDADPGTALPYTHTTPADWWISEPGLLYNTRQRCTSGCDFTRGDPNEHLYYETPYYDYALVIDYNTANAPGGVRPGAGSAFFLHVTDGGPTVGCVSIPMDELVTILRWLRPADHPRILLGVA